MLFSEYYGAYYACVSEILKEAVKGMLTRESMLAVMQKEGFAESVLAIPAHIKDESWPLVTKDYRTPLRHVPPHPATLLQKRWLKALLSDPRIGLFNVSDKGLEDVEPLFDPKKIVWYDRYSDGDPYEYPGYIARFRLLLEAVKTHRRVLLSYLSRRGRQNVWSVIPYRLEYSATDDKFRLLCESSRWSSRTLNLKRISDCRLTESFDPEDHPVPIPCNESITLEILDERNALERALLQFSYLAKKTERTGDHTYRMTLQYRNEDETELLIKILSFGPVVKVIAPSAFADLIRERITMQSRRKFP